VQPAPHHDAPALLLADSRLLKQPREVGVIVHTVEPGQRLRVTLLVDIIGVDQDIVNAAITHARQVGSTSFYLPTKIITAAGTCYEGTVVATARERFVLRLAGGDTHEFDCSDSEIFIEAL
jgi:hypothetical protein